MSVCRNHAVFLFVSTLSQFPGLDKITSPSARIPVVHRAPPPPPHYNPDSNWTTIFLLRIKNPVPKIECHRISFRIIRVTVYV